jgi:DEAD/DEAH box helicase domain-containing protein
MNNNRMEEFINSIKECPELGKEVVFHKLFSEKEPSFAETEKSWSLEMDKIIKGNGISKLYSHQADAIDLVRSGNHVVVSTPTASGKSLIYNLPVIEEMLREPSSRALYLFPLKALSQDQMKNFCLLTSSLYMDEAPSCATYDGDTPEAERRRVRRIPPNLLIVTPEMLHLSLLAYHSSWKMFWENLKFVVVDEVHTYKGVNGAHMAWVLRRMMRICEYYGSEPSFIFCSATVGNPAELASVLLSKDTVAVTESGAPMGRRHLLFLDPHAGAAFTAISLLKMH